MPQHEPEVIARTDGDDPFSYANSPSSPILFPVGERRVGWETRSGGYQSINTHKAIIRMTPDGAAAHALAVVGSGYKLVHNRELFGRVEDTMCKQMQVEHLHGVKVTDRVSGFGKTCYREYIFPNIKCYVGGHSKSTVAFRMIVQNGYGGSALRTHAGAIEFWCTNGMISGDFTSVYRKHTSGLVIEDIEKNVSAALESFVISQSRWRKWAQTEVKHGDAMQLFRDIATSPKLLNNLSDQYTREVDDRGPNLWAVYSALTYYASHNEGQFALRKSVEDYDATASIMLQRELNVAQWIKSDAWRKLELA